MKHKKGSSIRHPQHLHIQKKISLRIMLAAISFLIASILFTHVVTGSETLSVKVGAYENHPKIFINENNTVSGFWPELIEYIAKKENWEIEYIQGTWSEGLAGLEQKKIDIMPDVAFTEKRNKLYAFSKNPVLMSWARLYVNKENTDIQSIQDLENKKIAALRGSANLESEGGLREILREFNIRCRFIELDSYTKVFKAIDENRVDGGITNRNFGNKNAKNYAVKKTPVIFQPINIKFAFPSDSRLTPLLADKINHHIAQLVADEDSLYYQLLKKYFEAEIAEKKIEVFPDWLKIVLQGITALFIFFILVIIGSRFQVKRKTRELLNINKALILSEEKYRAIADEAPDLRYRTDMEGNIIYISQSVHKLSGYTAEEVIGIKIVEYYLNPEERESFLAALQKDGYVNNFLAQLKRKDGSIWWASSNAQFYKDNDGNILGVDGVTRDVTDLKKSEEKLIKAKKEWEKTFDAIPDIVTIQDKKMHIVRANKAATDFLAMKYEDLIGQKCHEVFLGYQEPCPGCPAIITLEHINSHTTTIEHKIQGKLFQISSSPILDQNKDVQYFVRTAQDITELKQLENKLLQSQKMEAIGTLAGGIAHDFNNILSAIIGYSELIKNEVSADSNVGKDIEKVLISGQRAADLVKQILTFSHKATNEKQPLRPHLIVKEALKMLRATLPATVDIKEDIDPDCGIIPADPTTIHQITVNLCTNALHAMTDEKGTLSISLQRRELSAARISGEITLYPGTFVVLSVSDTGRGMDKTTIDRIFEPYFTTKEVGRGTGLGLAVVHGIVQDCKGFIEVESTVGKGSTFSVYLPVMEEPAEQQAIAKQKDGAATTVGKERILIVDDEPLLVKINKKRLEIQGYQVTAVTDSRQALEKFRDQPDKFDLLITDQTMPELTGAELTKAVLEIKPSMPIIMCTGHSDTFPEEKALSMGIKKYIFKPLDGDDLLDAVREVLDQK